MVIGLTIAINLINFIGSFNFVRTNYIAAAIFKYGAIALRLALYTFMFVIIFIMKIAIKKYAPEEPHEEQK